MVSHESEADVRARETERQMTDDERFSLLFSLMPINIDGTRNSRVPTDVVPISGYAAGVPRLGIPALKLSDGSLGITNPFGLRRGDTATALPAGLMLGATFNPALAREAGAIVGREARSKGFNVSLSGAMNLVRDPRNGRNFEYISEDPLLSAAITGEMVNGTQSQGVIATVKHFSLNANETNRHWFDSVIDPAAHRESDLLAFQMAIERGQPGSVMGAYNKLNGTYCCGNATLLNDILKGAWGYKGWAMSDWGAVHDWSDALNGLDQESGAQLDSQIWFDQPLRAAYAEGRLPKERLSDMVRRILRSIYVVGLDKTTPPPTIDPAQHHATVLEIARQGIVLLKNDGSLPIAAGTKHIAIIGGNAHIGVISGGGSSAVIPTGGLSASVPLGGEGMMGAFRRQDFLPSSPLAELKKLLPDARFTYDPGAFPVSATALARRCDLAIAFVTRHECEGFDSPDLSLPFGQDALVDAVASANRNTVVVLETGNPVAMPWRDKAKAILAAWFPGQAGGQVVAEILVGKVNPSGRLPISFPASIEQTPRPELPGFGTVHGTPVTATFHEGAEVGYRWFAKNDAEPLYAFGHGLSYTTFSYSDLQLTGGETITATFTVTNSGKLEGADIPQLYLTEAPREKRSRLLAFERISLKPGESRQVKLTADPRLLARFDSTANCWLIAKGAYRVALGKSVETISLTAAVDLLAQQFGP